MSNSEENNSIIDEKEHYKSLVSMFKYLVSAITVLTGVAAWLIGGSITDIKTDISNELNRLKEEIGNLRTESRQVINESKFEADKQIDHLRKNTETYLNLTKEVTSMQIDILREDARNLALSSARQKIEESFKANDIQLLVESSAKKEIGERLNEIVENEIQKTRQVFDNFPILTSVYDRIRWGDRSALDILDSLANQTENPMVRKLAKEFLLQKGIDYEESIAPGGKIKAISQLNPLTELGLPDTTPLTSADTTKIRSALIEIILNDQDLDRVAKAFVGLRNQIGVYLKTFDITAARLLKIRN